MDTLTNKFFRTNSCFLQDLSSFLVSTLYIGRSETDIFPSFLVLIWLESTVRYFRLVFQKRKIFFKIWSPNEKSDSIFRNCNFFFRFHFVPAQWCKPLDAKLPPTSLTVAKTRPLIIISTVLFSFAYVKIRKGTSDKKSKQSRASLAPSFKKSGGFLMQNTTKTHQKMLSFWCVFDVFLAAP